MDRQTQGRHNTNRRLIYAPNSTSVKASSRLLIVFQLDVTTGRPQTSGSVDMGLFTRPASAERCLERTSSGRSRLAAELAV